MPESNQPPQTAADLLGDRPDPTATLAVTKADERRKALGQLKGHPAHQRADQAVQRVVAMHQVAEKELKEIRGKRDKRAFDASREYQKNELAKENEVTGGRDTFVSKVVAEEFLESLRVLDNESVGSPTPADRRKPNDAFHAAEVRAKRDTFLHALPEIGIPILYEAAGDPFAAYELWIAAKTEHTLAVTGKRTRFSGHEEELGQAVVFLELTAQTPFTIRREVVADMVAKKKQGIRDLLRLLERYQTTDPVFPQLAAEALRHFDNVDWLKNDKPK